MVDGWQKRNARESDETPVSRRHRRRRRRLPCPFFFGGGFFAAGFCCGLVLHQKGEVSDGAALGALQISPHPSPPRTCTCFCARNAWP